VTDLPEIVEAATDMYVHEYMCMFVFMNLYWTLIFVKKSFKADKAVHL